MYILSSRTVDSSCSAQNAFQRPMPRFCRVIGIFQGLAHSSVSFRVNLWCEQIYHFCFGIVLIALDERYSVGSSPRFPFPWSTAQLFSFACVPSTVCRIGLAYSIETVCALSSEYSQIWFVALDFVSFFEKLFFFEGDFCLQHLPIMESVKHHKLTLVMDLRF